MGNCYEDARPGLTNDNNPKQIILEADHHIMLNSTILSELRSLPPISKNITNRMQQLGPYLPTGYKDLGPIYQLRNKTVYHGRLKNKLFNGPGRLILADGTVIESSFQNGEPKNKTRIFKPNGDYFSGTIPEIGKTQIGIVHEKGITYEGEMINQKPHGLGKQYSKSYSYTGTYENGKKVNGLFQWNLDNSKNSQSYQGKFQNNLFEGQGTLINSSGKYVGNFEGGLKQGYGQMTYASNGKIYKGMFKRNKQDGQGKIYDSQGNLLQHGKWINGKKFNS